MTAKSCWPFIWEHGKMYKICRLEAKWYIWNILDKKKILLNDYISWSDKIIRFFFFDIFVKHLVAIEIH